MPDSAAQSQDEEADAAEQPPATEQLGASTAVNVETGALAFFCAAAIFCCSPWMASTSGSIAVGVMSGVPVMNSWLRLEFTVSPPLMPSTVAATPKERRLLRRPEPLTRRAGFEPATRGLEGRRSVR